jgi:hypothetical protein
MTHITYWTSLDFYDTVIKLMVITHYPLRSDRSLLEDMSRPTVVYQYALVMWLEINGTSIIITLLKCWAV